MKGKPSLLLPLMLLLLIACNRGLLTSDTSLSGYEVGTCYHEQQQGESVPCDQPHTYEVFAVTSYPAGDDEPFPGDASLRAFPSEECMSRFGAYTGHEYDRTNASTAGLGLAVRVPDEDSWAEGERSVICFVFQWSTTGGSPLHEPRRGSLRASRPASTPTPAADPGTVILGIWTATDPSTGRDFMFHFGAEGLESLAIIPSGVSMGTWGQYEGVGEDAVRLTFGSSVPVGQQGELCAILPSFLAALCESRVVEPVGPPSYPGPEGQSTPTPPSPEEVTGPPYPPPTPAPMVVSSVDEEFQVVIAGETMTLTHASGATQSFRRGVED